MLSSMVEREIGQAREVTSIILQSKGEGAVEMVCM